MIKKDYLEARTYPDLEVKNVFRSGCRCNKKHGWCAFVQYTESVSSLKILN